MTREWPGIYFATEPAGRTAKIAETGLAVWEVLRDYFLDQDVDGIHQAFGQLSQAPDHGRADARASLSGRDSRSWRVNLY